MARFFQADPRESEFFLELVSLLVVKGPKYQIEHH